MPRDLEGWNKRDRSSLKYTPEKLYEILVRIFPREKALEYFKQFEENANLSADVIESDTGDNTVLFVYPKDEEKEDSNAE